MSICDAANENQVQVAGAATARRVDPVLATARRVDSVLATARRVDSAYACLADVTDLLLLHVTTVRTHSIPPLNCIEGGISFGLSD